MGGAEGCDSLPYSDVAYHGRGFTVFLGSVTGRMFEHHTLELFVVDWRADGRLARGILTLDVAGRVIPLHGESLEKIFI